MDEVHTHRLHERKEYRGEQDDRGGGLHEDTSDQDDKTDQEEDDVGIARNGENSLRNHLRDLPVRQYPAERTGEADDQHDDGGGLRGVLHDLHEALRREVTVHEEADEDGVDNRDVGCLGRGEVAGEDTTEDDQRHEDAPDRMEEGPQDVLHAERCALRVVELPRFDEGDDDQDHTHRDARDEAVTEKSIDRLLCDDGVENHRNGWRDDDADRTGSRDEGGGLINMIATLLELRDEGRTDGCGGRCTRSGNRGEEHAGEDGNDGEAATDPAEEGLCELDEHLRHGTLRHEVPGEDEERNRDQREAVLRSEDTLHHHEGRHITGDEGDEGGDGDGEADRNAEKK